MWKHAIVVLTHDMQCRRLNGCSPGLKQVKEVARKTKFLEKVTQWKEKVSHAVCLWASSQLVYLCHMRDKSILVNNGNRMPSAEYLAPDASHSSSGNLRTKADYHATDLH